MVTIITNKGNLGAKPKSIYELKCNCRDCEKTARVIGLLGKDHEEYYHVIIEYTEEIDKSQHIRIREVY